MSLPYSLIGEDYLLYYQNHPANIWTTSGQIQKFLTHNCNTARLGFAFADAPPTSTGKHTHSVYVKEKMLEVLAQFQSVGVKVILDNHNVNDHKDYCGSQKWIQNWRQLAMDFKGNSSVVGFNIFNEPNKSTWDHSLILDGKYDTNAFMLKMKECIEAIWSIDGQRKIFFPTVQGMGIGLDNPQDFMGLVNAFGLNKQNIIFDISHPYYWENDWDLGAGLTPELALERLEQNTIIPYKSLLGANRCWIGESFAWTGKTRELQVRWLAGLIDLCLKHKIGLQIWSYFGKQTWCNEAIQKSGWPGSVGGEPIPEHETPQPQDINALAILIFAAAIAALEGR